MLVSMCKNQPTINQSKDYRRTQIKTNSNTYLYLMVIISFIRDGKFKIYLRDIKILIKDIIMFWIFWKIKNTRFPFS